MRGYIYDGREIIAIPYNFFVELWLPIKCKLSFLEWHLINSCASNNEIFIICLQNDYYLPPRSAWSRVPPHTSKTNRGSSTWKVGSAMLIVIAMLVLVAVLAIAGLALWMGGELYTTLAFMSPRRAVCDSVRCFFLLTFLKNITRYITFVFFEIFVMMSHSYNIEFNRNRTKICWS